MAKVTIIIEDDYKDQRVKVYAEIEKNKELEKEVTEAEHFATSFFELIAEGADEVVESDGSVTYTQGGTGYGKH